MAPPPMPPKPAKFTDNGGDAPPPPPTGAPPHKYKKEKKKKKAPSTLVKKPSSLVSSEMINISHVEKVNDDGESYYAFFIHVSPSDVSRGDSTTHIIPRAYREFVEFDKNWKSAYPGVKHIKLPAKRMLNTVKNLEKQRELLEDYLHAMLAVSAVRADLAEFLSVSPDIWEKVVRRHSVIRRKQLRQIDSAATIVPPPPMEDLAAFAQGGASPGLEDVMMSLNEWDRIRDEESGRYYYHNNETGKTTWKAPAMFAEFGEIPDVRPMEDLMTDDDDNNRGGSGGLRRSFRAITKLVAAPAKTPAKKTKAASKGGIGPTAPKRTGGAAPGARKGNKKSPWRAAVDIESGETYYFHKTTGETSWEEPPGFLDSSAHNRRPSVRRGLDVKAFVKQMGG